ncbi:solute carrier family 25 member 36-like isoform X2 [Gigantopelta aegis]|uniref:solute carrier family 25 member 36-like isoform X2 n=1 Tax=Gigantopelta aegis TaxID=1735272 RepID=UPI001B8876B3|nr:solute carrier family 25 member 36-like isoform X2 [Gigantopelta aegis]
MFHTCVYVEGCGTVSGNIDVSYMYTGRDVALYLATLMFHIWGWMWHCICRIKETEGYRGLFKGLGPNLMGIIPAKAIYFFTYAKMKKLLNEVMNPDTPLVHICSSFVGGFTVTTLTSPIWLVKTRLQLDQKREGKLTMQKCVRRVYQQHGLSGFYKGVTASYIGISETVIQFVFYEEIKSRLQFSNHDRMDEDLHTLISIGIAGSLSKAIATCIAYPHEVVRTRLREEGTKYKSLAQTFLLILQEEGKSGLYRGLTTQLVRQLPNSAIIMVTYESVVKVMELVS